MCESDFKIFICSLTTRLVRVTGVMIIVVVMVTVADDHSCQGRNKGREKAHDQWLLVQDYHLTTNYSGSCPLYRGCLQLFFVLLFSLTL